MGTLAASEIRLFDVRLQLLEERALYLPETKALLVADVHLGKAETLQALGIPISNSVNTENLEQLRQLCCQLQPEALFILGDLFHSRAALVPEVLAAWAAFLAGIEAAVTLIVGNHDRPLVAKLPPLAMATHTAGVVLGSVLLSHEPEQKHSLDLNICGHVHPVLRLRSQADCLRLPCFFLEHAPRRLTLPSFGAVTGGYEVAPRGNDCAYVVCDGEAIAFEAQS